MRKKRPIPYLAAMFALSPVLLPLVTLKFAAETLFLFGYAADIRARYIVFKMLLANKIKSYINPGAGTNDTSVISLKNGNVAFKAYLRNNSVDANTFRDIFITKDYDFPTDIEPRVIFDLGANAGYCSQFFALKYPKAEIYAFEPVSENFRMLELNSKDIGRIKTHKKAVFSKKMETEFFLGDICVTGSLIGSGRTEKVECVTLDDFMEEHGIQGIDILKFDIEGAELEVFKAFKNYDRVKYIIGELHYRIIKKEEIPDILKAKGFSVNYKQANENISVIVGSRGA